MAAFTFEVIRQGEAPVIFDVLAVPDEQAVWCQVEALALRIKSGDGAFIRVKNCKGETLVLTGVATALASIETCSCTACPLKKGLEQLISLGSSAAAGLGLDFVPCDRRGDRSCKGGGLS